MFGTRQTAFEDARGFIHVALSTLAMGDNASCEFAQGSHLGLLYRHGVISPEELLCPCSPPPRGLLSVGIVIDDLVILERVVRGCLEPEPEGRLGPVRLDMAHRAYSEAGLLANPAKGARDEAIASFWGVTLDGEECLVRPNMSRLGPLTCITARVAALGLCSRPLLESLVGCWTSIFLLRRRCLSLFGLCFEALRATAGSDIIRLSAGLVDELWTWTLIGSACVADLRAPVLDTLYATDASDTKVAGVALCLPGLLKRSGVTPSGEGAGLSCFLSPRLGSEPGRCLTLSMSCPEGKLSRLIPCGDAWLEAYPTGKSSAGTCVLLHILM